MRDVIIHVAIHVAIPLCVGWSFGILHELWGERRR